MRPGALSGRQRLSIIATCPNLVLLEIAFPSISFMYDSRQSVDDRA